MTVSWHSSHVFSNNKRIVPLYCVEEIEMSRVTLSQWQMLAAVVDHGGFARAAEAVHKSPSTLNHAVHKLEEQLGVQVLEPIGRQVRLTEAGELLLRRARQLIESAASLEDVATRLAAGLEAEIVVAIDQVFPTGAQAKALERFSETYPQARPCSTPPVGRTRLSAASINQRGLVESRTAMDRYSSQYIA